MGGKGAPETIAAVATPPGRGGIGIVRISGPRVAEIARALLGALPQARQAVYQSFRDPSDGPIDTGIALYFPAPGSFTGEDVLELHGHGGPVVMDLLLASVLRLGARAAGPGEFSERAFLNGKLDLAQAEAIADLIDSDTQQAARSAHRSLQGQFSRRIRDLTDGLTDLRAFVEAAIDFAEEEVDFLSQTDLEAGIERIGSQLEAIIAGAYQGALLRDGMTVVIAGRPNVGKSSLLNALAGHDSAIVTELPGTTRDVLRERIQLDGMPVHVLDTAGLRDTEDQVEKLGIQRAWDAIAHADAILLVVDDRHGLGEAEEAILRRLPQAPEPLIVHNKIDLTGRQPALSEEPFGEALYVSARTGEGIDILNEHLKGMMGFTGEAGTFMARRRHLEALRHARQWLDAAAGHLLVERAGELVAEDLRQAQQHLGEITGEVTSDDLLGRIFASFCIGK